METKKVLFVTLTILFSLLTLYVIGDAFLTAENDSGICIQTSNYACNGFYGILVIVAALGTIGNIFQKRWGIVLVAIAFILPNLLSEDIQYVIFSLFWTL